jgi:hypothetical protein
VVEHLSFILPSTSLYQLKVHYDGNLFGTIDNENYGLAWSGVAVAQTDSADFDENGIINGNDLLIWQRGYDPSCTTCTLVDGDADNN